MPLVNLWCECNYTTVFLKYGSIIMRTVSRKAYLKNLQLAIKNDQQIARARKGLVAPIPVRKEEDRAITDPVEIRSKARDNLISMFGPTRADQFLAGLSQNDIDRKSVV